MKLAACVRALAGVEMSGAVASNASRRMCLSGVGATGEGLSSGGPLSSETVGMEGPSGLGGDGAFTTGISDAASTAAASSASRLPPLVAPKLRVGTVALGRCGGAN